ncbi:MAG: hypothetical protein LC131_15070 [Anaerolineae bacterium]|nr:hypothetical protein [Anaerolineae bacterium]
MLTDTWLLMKLYWKLDGRTGSGRGPWRIIALIIAILGTIFMIVMSAITGWGLSFLVRPGSPVALPPGILPGLMLTVVLLGVLFTGMNQSMKALYLNGDLDRLMVAPINTRAVMVSKLLSRLPWTFVILFALTGPATIAYGIGLGAGPVYYLLGLLMLLCAPLFGLAVGALLAMVLVRVMPVDRLNELMTAAYALVGILIAIAAQAPRLYMTGGEVEVTLTGDKFADFGASLARMPIPTMWAGQGLMTLDAGRFDPTGLLGIALYLLLTLGLFALVITTADGLYLSGWLKTQSAGGKRRGLEAAGERAKRRTPAMAIALKDWRMRLRDARQLVTIFGVGFMAIVIGALAIFRPSPGGENLMNLGNMDIPVTAPAVVHVLIAMFSRGALVSMFGFYVGFSLLANMASYAMALEGQSFPLLKAAPIRGRDVWSAKLRGVYLPFVGVFVVTLVVGWIFTRYSLAWAPYAVAIGLMAGYAILAANTSAGFRYANLEWTDPRRMMTQSGGLVSLLISLAYGLPAAIIALLGFGLAQVYFHWAWLFAGVALLLVAGMTLIMHVIMSRWGESAWDKLPA